VTIKFHLEINMAPQNKPADFHLYIRRKRLPIFEQKECPMSKVQQKNSCQPISY